MKQHYLRYQQSNPLALAMTLTLYGKAVYGKENYVWYYEANGAHRMNVESSNFTLRFYPGDCTNGNAKFTISINKSEFRDMTDVEINSAVLRSGIEHDCDNYHKNKRLEAEHV